MDRRVLFTEIFDSFGTDVLDDGHGFLSYMMDQGFDNSDLNIVSTAARRNWRGFVRAVREPDSADVFSDRFHTATSLDPEDVLSLIKDMSAAFSGNLRDTLRYAGGMYSGQTAGGVPDGRGVLTYPNGDVYDGSFSNGVYDGEGRFTWGRFSKLKGASYEGTFREGRATGSGRLVYPDRSVYSGGFRNGVRDGEGVFRFSTGEVYEGSFSNGHMNGRGKFTRRDGRQFEGRFDMDRCTKDGVYRDPA